jgi:hypothetical protein
MSGTDFPHGWNEIMETTSEAVEWLPQTAEALRELIYHELEGTTVACFALEQSWTRLGILLAEFKMKEHWRKFAEYKTLDDFIRELKHKFNRGRTQLYGYMGACETMLPLCSRNELEKMGISKVLELKRAVKQLPVGTELPQELVQKALNPEATAKELRADVGKFLHAAPDDHGTWMDLDGFYITPEERKEFKEAWLATEALLNIKPDVPEHLRRKAVFLTWMREWWGTHAKEYFDGK